MKKIFALLPLIAVLGLAGCGEKEDETETGGGDSLQYNEEQVKENVRQLAATEGYEISCELASSGDEAASQITIGSKDNFVWYYMDGEKSLHHLENNVYQAYTYDEEVGFKKSGGPIDLSEHPEYSYVTTVTDAYSTFFYAGVRYTSEVGLTKVNDNITFAGRSATEYKYSFDYAGYGAATYQLIVDNETGITLKWYVSGTSYVDGEGGSASFEVKSFKTGNDVVVPAHEA